MSHLKRTTRIHAPLGSVYNLAHDPKHWSDWYVGISREIDLDEGRPAVHKHRLLMIGAPFPLTQKVLEDRQGLTEAHWRVKSQVAAEKAAVTPDCDLLMIGGDYDWTYEERDGETEVTVVMDYTVPSEMLERESDRPLVERTEAECIEESLENLKRLCEKAA